MRLSFCINYAKEDSELSIVLEKLNLHLGGRRVLRELSACFQRGRVTAVVGPNGSGKSSLFRAVYGYLPIEDGLISVDGQDLRDWEPSALAKHLGVCPQEAEASLDFVVEQVLCLRFGGDRSKLAGAVEEFSFLKLDELWGRKLSELSGGERQRVRLGVALSSRAPWFILDEPGNHLDLATAWSLLEYLTIKREGGVILALHDLATAARCCDDLLVLHEGKKVAFGQPKEVLTTELLRDVFRLRAELEQVDGSLQLRVQGAVGV